MKLREDGAIFINFLVSSEKRKNLLLLLCDGSKTLAEIRDSLGVTSSGIIPEIRKIEKKNLIYSMNRKYALTEIGDILAEYIYRLDGTLQSFSKNPKFWNEHKISGIPYELRLRLYELGDYKIIKSTPTNIFGPQEECTNNLLKARWIKGICPVLHPEYFECIFNLAESGVDVSIIVPEELLENIKERYKAEMERCITYKNPCIMVCNEKIEIDINVGDSFFLMRLFLKDGTYDFFQNIASLENSALRWGEDLFRFYKIRSKRVKI